MDRVRKSGLSIVSAFAILLISVAFAGCLDETTEEGLKEFTDPTGNSFWINGTLERIVTLTPALTEIVVELGAGELLIGADSVSASENSGLGLETVSTWEGLDQEKLVEIAPDLVIMDKTLDITGSIFNAINVLTIPVYRAFPTDFDSVLTMITDIGELLDHKDEAIELVDEMDSKRNAVVDSVSSVPRTSRPTVLYVMYYDGTSDPWVGTSSTFSGDMIEMAGGDNVISDEIGVVIQVSVETIIDEDPGIIITSQSTVWPTTSRSTILSEDIWKDITAVKNGAVFDIEGNLIDRTGPYLADGLVAINEAIYP